MPKGITAGTIQSSPSDQGNFIQTGKPVYSSGGTQTRIRPTPTKKKS